MSIGHPELGGGKSGVNLVERQCVVWMCDFICCVGFASLAMNLMRMFVCTAQILCSSSDSDCSRRGSHLPFCYG